MHPLYIDPLVVMLSSRHWTMSFACELYTSNSNPYANAMLLKAKLKLFDPYIAKASREYLYI
jgi:hypothetical protein